jgi:hypothetical protein
MLEWPSRCWATLAVHSSPPPPLLLEAAPELVTCFRREARLRDMPIARLRLTAAILDHENPPDVA